MEMLMEYMARGFITMLSISMPCVLVAAGIGLVVGILQAVTQVQEQTIAAAPKILAVFMVIIIGGVGFVRILTNLFTDGMAMAFNVIPKNDSYVLPPNYYKYTRPFASEMQENFKTPDRDSFKKMTSGKPGGIGGKQNQNQIYQKAPYVVQPKADLMERQKIYNNANR